MDNYEFAEHLKRLLDDENFINDPLFNELKESCLYIFSSYSEPVLQACKALYEAIKNFISANMPAIAEAIVEAVEEYLCTLTNTHPHIKHLALHSKKIRVRKKNYKRIYQRQKIP